MSQGSEENLCLAVCGWRQHPASPICLRLCEWEPACVGAAAPKAFLSAPVLQHRHRAGKTTLLLLVFPCSYSSGPLGFILPSLALLAM